MATHDVREDWCVREGDTVVLADYHMCRYDALLGVLLCVGDDAPALVLGRDLCRTVVALPPNTHWLDCFVFAGTTTFMVLARDVLLCLDYRTTTATTTTTATVLSPPSSRALTAASRRTRFTCLHVPQGLTRGAVGGRDGRVCYFAMQNGHHRSSSSDGDGVDDEDDRDRSVRAPASLAWAAKETDVLALCRPYMTSSRASPPHTRVDDNDDDDDSAAAAAASHGCLGDEGAVLALDSYPDNPNAFVAVLAGVRGVCKWYVDEGRVSCFFSANAALAAVEAAAVTRAATRTSAAAAGAASTTSAEATLATCKVTPGGAYVVAATQSGRTLLVWDERQKKSKTRVAEVHWVVQLSDLVRGLGDAAAFANNDYRVGICIARSSSSASSDAMALLTSQTTATDKHSDMYVLVHGRRDVVEVVLRVDERRVVRRDTIIAGLHATSASATVTSTTSTAHVQPQHDVTHDVTHDDYFSIFHVEPCVLSSYWSGAWADADLDALIVTSAGGLRPILAQRNRHAGGVERLTELRELSATAAWARDALPLRLPRASLCALAQQQQRQQQLQHKLLLLSSSSGGGGGGGGTAACTTWERLLRGGDTLLMHCVADSSATTAATRLAAHADTSAQTSQLCDELVVLTVTDAAEAVCLSPRSDELFALRAAALRECAPWTALAVTGAAVGDAAAAEAARAEDAHVRPSTAGHAARAEELVLEQALPSPTTCASAPTEVLLRVCANASTLTVVKLDVRRGTGAVLLVLDRAALQLPPRRSSGDDDGAEGSESMQHDTVAGRATPHEQQQQSSTTRGAGACMVKQAICLDATLAVSPVTGRCRVRREVSKCLLLLLEDESVVLVSLAGDTDGDGRPCMLHLPASLLPMHARVRRVAACWLPVHDHATTTTTSKTTTAATEADTLALCVVYLFADRHGVLVWNASAMRMLGYTSPSYTHDAHTLCIATTASPLLLPPRLSGDVTRFVVTLPCSLPATTTTTAAATTTTVLPPGAYGDVCVCDTLGMPLLTLYLAVGLADDATDKWCCRHTRTDAWTATALTAAITTTSTTTVLTLCVRLAAGALTWSLRTRTRNRDDGSSDTDSVDDSDSDDSNDAVHVHAVPHCAVGDVRAHWSLGSCTLHYTTRGDDSDDDKAATLRCTHHYRLDDTSCAASSTRTAATTCGADNTRAAHDARTAAPTATTTTACDTALVFVSTHALALVPVAALLLPPPSPQPQQQYTSQHGSTAPTSGSAAVAVATLEAGRRVERVLPCVSTGLLLTVTRDESGWRWLSVLDTHTARPRARSYATLDFVDDADVRVVCVDVKGTPHVYCIGAQSGVVAHFTITLRVDGDGGDEVVLTSRRVRGCFAGRRHQPVPSTFRDYGRYLPPPPTMKQESGFFKRLMTPPWEDVARKLETDTLRCVSSTSTVTSSSGSGGVGDRATATATTATTTAAAAVVRASTTMPRHADARASLPPPPQVTTATAAPPPRRVDAAATTTATTAASASSSQPPPQGQSRYAQLKAIAEREHVSLSEARRMMSENVRRLQERGERLSELQNKSSELAQSALTFESLARQLQAKQRSGWVL